MRRGGAFRTPGRPVVVSVDPDVPESPTFDSSIRRTRRRRPTDPVSLLRPSVVGDVVQLMRRRPATTTFVVDRRRLWTSSQACRRCTNRLFFLSVHFSFHHLTLKR